MKTIMKNLGVGILSSSEERGCKNTNQLCNRTEKKNCGWVVKGTVYN